MVARIFVPLTAAALASALLGAHGATQRSLDARLAYEYPIEIPDILTSDILRARLGTVSQIARIPVGFEQISGDAAILPQPDRAIDVRGMSVRAALDVLVDANPRYTWREVDGIAVMRPAGAWTDCSHFLNRRLSVTADNLQLNAALSLLWKLLNPTSKNRRRAVDFGGTPFSIGASNATLFDILNEVARRGSLSWFLTHHPSAEGGDKESISLTLMELDGRRSGLTGTMVLAPISCAR